MFLSKEHHTCTFSSKHTPALYVYPGERVTIETWDCYGGLFFDHQQEQEQPVTNPTSIPIDRSKLNPVTGPIYIHTAQPGDVLAVTIHDIQPHSLGVAQCGPTFGQLAHTVTQHHFRFFDITRPSMSSPTAADNESHQNKKSLPSEFWNITMREEVEEVVESTLSDHSNQPRQGRRTTPISFMAKPMIGVLGVAPPPPIESISTMPAGNHGGNLDNPFNTIGSTIYLPIYHTGALFSVGDVHASQGDGEICGTGVEVGAKVVLSFQVLSQESISRIPNQDHDDKTLVTPHPFLFPITETATSFMTYGIILDDIPQSTVVACDEASTLLQQQWNFTAPDAYIFLGVCGHLGLCQCNHPDTNNTPIARMVIPKIEACPRPFACLANARKNSTT